MFTIDFVPAQYSVRNSDPGRVPLMKRPLGVYATRFDCSASERSLFVVFKRYRRVSTTTGYKFIAPGIPFSATLVPYFVNASTVTIPAAN